MQARRHYRCLVRGRCLVQTSPVTFGRQCLSFGAIASTLAASRTLIETFVGASGPRLAVFRILPQVACPDGAAKDKSGALSAPVLVQPQVEAESTMFVVNKLVFIRLKHDAVG